MILTKDKLCPVAEKSTRIVHGGRGDYMEIAPEDLWIDGLSIPADQTWRTSPGWIDKVYYIWWETPDKVKLYHQLKTVDYADYKVGYWYVDPLLVTESTINEQTASNCTE